MGIGKIYIFLVYSTLVSTLLLKLDSLNSRDSLSASLKWKSKSTLFRALQHFQPSLRLLLTGSGSVIHTLREDAMPTRRWIAMNSWNVAIAPPPWRSTHRFGAVRHKWPMTDSPKPFRLAYEIAAGRRYINKKCVRPRINALVSTPSELSPRKYVIGDRRSSVLCFSAVRRRRACTGPSVKYHGSPWRKADSPRWPRVLLF